MSKQLSPAFTKRLIPNCIVLGKGDLPAQDGRILEVRDYQGTGKTEKDAKLQALAKLDEARKSKTAHVRGVHLDVVREGYLCMISAAY